MHADTTAPAKRQGKKVFPKVLVNSLSFPIQWQFIKGDHISRAQKTFEKAP